VSDSAKVVGDFSGDNLKNDIAANKEAALNTDATKIANFGQSGEALNMDKVNDLKKDIQDMPGKMRDAPGAALNRVKDHANEKIAMVKGMPDQIASMPDQITSKIDGGISSFTGMPDQLRGEAHKVGQAGSGGGFLGGVAATGAVADAYMAADSAVQERQDQVQAAKEKAQDAKAALTNPGSYARDYARDYALEQVGGAKFAADYAAVRDRGMLNAEMEEEDKEAEEAEEEAARLEQIRAARQNKMNQASSHVHQRGKPFSYSSH